MGINVMVVDDSAFMRNMLKKIITESAPLTTEAIVHFAEKFNTHPAIIIGRLQHLKLIPFSEGKEFIQAIDLSEWAKKVSIFFPGKLIQHYQMTIQ